MTPSFVPGPSSLILRAGCCKGQWTNVKGQSGDSLKGPLDDRAHCVDIFVGNRRRRHEEARPIRAAAGYECYDAQVEEGREEALDERLIAVQRSECDHRAQAEGAVDPAGISIADVL